MLFTVRYGFCPPRYVGEAPRFEEKETQHLGYDEAKRLIDLLKKQPNVIRPEMVSVMMR